MDQINYEKLLPVQPTEDITDYAYKNGEFRSVYLIYRSDWVYDPQEGKKREMVKVICTACGETFYAEKIKAGECPACTPRVPFGWQYTGVTEPVTDGHETFCPMCGTAARTVHIGSMTTYGGEIIDDVWVSTLSRLPVEGKRDRLVLMDWLIRRCINKQGESRYEIWPYTAWVVEERKIVRLMAYTKCLTTISLSGNWTQRKTFVDVYRSADLIFPWDKSLLEGTTAENCKLDLYQESGGCWLVSYLALWRKRPQVENLIVQGCGNLLDQWIKTEAQSYNYKGGIPKLPDVNWKEKRPAQMLGLNKSEFAYMRQLQWNTDDLKRYKMVRDSGLAVHLPEDAELLKSAGTYDCSRILSDAPKADFWRILRYLKKQKRDWSILKDYWSMSRNLGRDMTDSLVRWPRNLLEAHDKVTGEQKFKEEEALRTQFAERLVSLEPLSYQSNGLMIRPCRTQAEMNDEGKHLHHCVASYAKRHTSGKTAILFIRHTDAPDEPFFTLEYDEKSQCVRQNRGLRNCKRTPEVEAFESEWLAWVHKSQPQKGAITA